MNPLFSRTMALSWLFKWLHQHTAALLLTLTTTSLAFANPCSDLLEGKDLILAAPSASRIQALERIEPTELEQTHPAIAVLEKNKKKFVEKHGSSESLDSMKLLKVMEAMNAKLPGKFQAYPYNGGFFFFYIEGKNAWEKSTEEYGKVLLSFIQEEPAIFDSIGSYKTGDSRSNATEVQESKLAEYVSASAKKSTDSSIDFTPIER